MKTLFIVALFLLPITASAFFEQNIIQDRYLYYGSKGDDVLELQDFLNYVGCLKVSPTGFFGILTLKGVKCFQSQYKIIPTGVLNKETIKKINQIIYIEPQPMENNKAQGVSPEVVPEPVKTEPTPPPEKSSIPPRSAQA